MNTSARRASAALAFLAVAILPGYAQTQFSFSYTLPITGGGTITASGTLTTTGTISPYQVTAISGTRTVTGASSGNGTATITGLITDPAANGYAVTENPNLLYYGVTPVLSTSGIFYTISNGSQEDAHGGIEIYYDQIGGAYTENSTLVGDGTFTAAISSGGSGTSPDGIAIISGNTQAAAQGAAFQPLVVQVNSATGPLANYSVLLSSTGPVVLSSSTVTTGNNGQASIPVTAGTSSSGAATVTASVTGGYSVTFNLTVNAATGQVPASIAIVSGNNQAVAQGAAFQPLVVQVNSTTGPLANYSVALSSTGPVMLSSSTVTTGNNGQASIPVTAGASSSGAATVTASVTGGYSVTFNLMVNAAGGSLPTGIAIISGNNQAVAQGAAFQPLVVQVNTSTGPLAFYPVVLSTTGPIGLSFSTVTTNSNGQASIQVTAGLLSGAATVTASITGYSVTFNLTVNSAGSMPTGIAIVNTQAVAQGAAFQPLVVQVNSTTGPLLNYPVVLSATGPVVLSSSTVSTGSNGQASIPVTAGTSSGAATVTASVSGGYSVTFDLTVNPAGSTPTGIAIVSGNTQAVAQGVAFQPLVVQVNDPASPLATYTVNLSSTGPVVLSSLTVTTGSNGQASILVTAGTASGPATVTASVNGGYSVTFNLTVNPPGPVLTANSFLNAASGAAGQLSPCSLAIISAAGLTPDAGIADLTSGPIFGRWPKSVNNLSVTFGGVPAPILLVSPGSGTTNPQVMLQVPCEVTPGNSVPVVVNVNGGATATIDIPIFVVSPGILTQPMSDGVVRAVATRADGSFADVGGTDSYDPNNPVRQNENVRFYLTGLGITTPAIGTDYIESPDAGLASVDAVVAGNVVAGIVNGPTLQVISARAAPDLLGIYEIEVAIPANAPTGNSVGLQIGITPLGGTTTVYAPNVIVPIAQ
jgi:adhesin/invasin